jgi:hypothetical protein
MVTPLRAAHTEMCTHTSGNKVILLNTGNYPSYSSYLNEINSWNGTVWSSVTSGLINANAPLPVRTDGALGYDGTNLILFGGRGDSSTSGVLGDTWQITSAGVCTLLAPATSPFGRFQHEMCYLTSNTTLLMFGGSNSLNLLNDLWTWTHAGGTWTLQATTGSIPSARTRFGFAANATKAFVFGGAGTNSMFNDLYYIDSTYTWTKVTPTGSIPPVMMDFSFSYDSNNANFVLFGGQTGLGPSNATYTYDPVGNSWTLKSPVYTMPSLYGAQMSFDPVSNSVIMFGGINGATNYPSNVTYSWSGTNWSVVA